MVVIWTPIILMVVGIPGYMFAKMHAQKELRRTVAGYKKKTECIATSCHHKLQWHFSNAYIQGRDDITDYFWWTKSCTTWDG